eukprot:s6061_g5.t1
MSAVTEEEQGSGAEWHDEWNHWSPDDWSNDDWSWEEQDWNGEWIGSVNDWSGDWSWFEDDWSSWPEDWSWNIQEWWSSAEAQPQSSNGATSSGSNVPQDTAKNEPPQNVSAVTVDSSDQSAPRVRARTGEEPEELERKVRVSRNVEEHELENVLRYTMFFDSSDSTMIDTGHQNEWADIELPDGSVKKCENPRGPTGHQWTGYTLFVPLDRPTAGENAEQETEDRSALKPKMLKVPGEPLENERRLHELTHLPYRDWCEHCVRSKGRQSHAVKKKKKTDRQPVIQIDFSFMATENDLPKRTILNATDVQPGYSMAVVLPSKGSVEKYAVAELRKFVFEIGRTFGIVQYDKEAPLKTMARDLCVRDW